MKRLVITLLATALTVPVAAQQKLRDGLLVDAHRNAAYIMTPDGGVASIALTTGDIRWKTDAAAKPLGLIENRLVAQVESDQAVHHHMLLLAVLDADRGTPLARSSIQLPESVFVAVTRSLCGRFTAIAWGDGLSGFVKWTYQPSLVRGMEAEDEVEEVVVPRALTGTHRIHLGTGETARVETAPGEPAGHGWVIAASEIDPSPATQYESADRRHILTSERIADASAWNDYRWTLTDRASEARLGEIRIHIGFAPFIVRDSTLVFETTPYRVGDDAQPAKLRGFDLRTGREAWSVEVREVEYREELPP